MERSQQVAFPRPKRKGDATGAGVGQGQKACRNAGLTPDVCQGQDRRGTPCFMLSSPPSVLGAAEDSADDSPSSGRRFAEADVPASSAFSLFPLTRHARIAVVLPNSAVLSHGLAIAGELYWTSHRRRSKQE